MMLPMRADCCVLKERKKEILQTYSEMTLLKLLRLNSRYISIQTTVFNSLTNVSSVASGLSVAQKKRM